MASDLPTLATMAHGDTVRGALSAPPHKQRTGQPAAPEKHASLSESLSNVVLFNDKHFLQPHLWNITWQKRGVFFFSRLFFPFFKPY